VSWNVGVLTNLAPEHIESHGSFENYRNAKLNFLKYVLRNGGKVFLNRDDANFSFFSETLTKGKTAEYSKSDAWLREYLPKLTPMHSMYGDHMADKKFLIKGFNEENIAVAVAIAKDLGIGNQIIERAIASFEGVPGRMEFVRMEGYTGVVDYAHTPESLEAAYKALSPESGARNPEGKLICVLSAAGGGRDRWKRPEMGKVAAHYCDEIVVTNEDPYDEDPQTIMNEVISGIMAVPYPRPSFTVEPDRRAAIEKAVGMMNLEDIVIATGKGSEEWIHLARGKKIPWNERQIMEDVLVEKKNRPAPRESQA
jgi:UDP-N-acetylmuramoyl-L-alanyl-D-glutamate--2,6-diaminopimelate ligase